jgi:hypothetical protein
LGWAELDAMSEKFCAVLGCEAESYGWIDLFKQGDGIVRTYFCEHHYRVVAKCAAEYKEEHEEHAEEGAVRRRADAAAHVLPIEEAVRALRVEGLE